MKFKESVYQYLYDCSDEVKTLKTANTLIQRNGKLYGYNTDVAGIAVALANIALFNKQVLVMGAGGAARALGYFLKLHQAKIIWINRDEQKAINLAKEFGGDVISLEQVKSIALDIIINATSVGLYPHIHDSLLLDYIFNSNQIVFDMVYNPVITPLLQRAQKYNATIRSGLDMFIGQGLKQIELLINTTLDHTILTSKLRTLLIKSVS